LTLGGTILKLGEWRQGSFVATINARSSPRQGARRLGCGCAELLDNFRSRFRKELSKSGELKNQRVGSQDITKQ